jgi:CBS-domain-containing membrane protein
MHAAEPVNRFMTEVVVCVDLSSPAGDILRMFAEYPVHHLPVLDKTKVVGMVSSADVLKLEGVLPSRAVDPVAYLNQHLSTEKVMRRPPICIHPHQSIGQAASLMARHGIHALPVTDSGENLVGIITTTDIIHAALYPERRGEKQDAGAPDSSSLEVRVSPLEMSEALKLAAGTVGADDDQGKLARALLHAHSRLKPLESVLSCAARYVHAGQDERLHASLTKAIDRARSGSSEPTVRFGL